MLKYVIFDLDDTLLDFSRGEHEGILNLLKKYGITDLQHGLQVYQAHNHWVWSQIEHGADPEPLLNQRFAVVIAFEETGKITLGKERGAAELVELEPYDACGGDAFIALDFLVAVDGTVLGRNPSARRKPCVDVLLLPSCSIPGCGVLPAVVTVEDKSRACAGGASADQLTCVTQRDASVCRAVELRVHIVLPVGDLLQAHGLAVEGEADGVENDALAGSGRTADKEERCASQRVGREIYGLALNRADVLYCKLLEFHIR